MPLSFLDHSVVTPADLAACRQMIRDGSKTFYAASLLLPQRICDAARSLYGFSRVADDLVDQSTDSQAAVEQLLGRLDRIYRGAPDNQPADRAFADVAARYERLSDPHGYAVRVAGTVGAMMSLVMEVRDPEALARACDPGIAMQLTNIARDVGDDARIGRLYLPAEWLVMKDEALRAMELRPRSVMLQRWPASP